jgi:hypothetical protein
VSTVGPLLVLVAFAVVLFALSQPFWPGQVERAAEADALRRADLEAAKVAKYREIRDAALDHDTGKLSDADWKPIDARLRAEAVAILDELDGLAHVRGTPDTGREELPGGAAAPLPADAAGPAEARDAARGGDPADPAGPAGAADPATAR